MGASAFISATSITVVIRTAEKNSNWCTPNATPAIAAHRHCPRVGHATPHTC
jgi:hypothetical protein